MAANKQQYSLDEINNFLLDLKRLCQTHKLYLDVRECDHDKEYSSCLVVETFDGMELGLVSEIGRGNYELMKSEL